MNLLVFGDSITQGFFDEERGGWCARLAQYAMQRALETNHEYYVSVFNLGISGDCTGRLLNRFDAEAATRTKDGNSESVILFSIGVNDTQRYVKNNQIKTASDEFKENLKTLYSNANKYAGRTVFTGILPIIEEIVQPMPWAEDRSHFAKDVVEYDQILKDFCSDKGCFFIPFQDIFTGYNLQDVLVDGIHPNAEGHRLIFERVKSSLEKENIL